MLELFSEMLARWAGQSTSMIRRLIWAGLLTIAIWIWLQHQFPSHPPGGAATAVVFAVMFGLVYAVERLAPIMLRLASAAVRRSSHRCASNSTRDDG